jgi:uncharacterized protein DUF3309
VSLLTLLLVVLVVAVVAGAPVWPHSRSWGYGPSALVTVLVILLLLHMLGVIRLRG